IAVLRYEGHSGFPSKPQDVNYAFTYRNGLQLNTLNEAPGDGTTFYSAADIRNQDHFEDVSAYAREPDYKIWLESDFYPRDDDWVHNKDFYPFFGVKKNLRLFMPQMNNITFKLPNVPPLSQPEEVNETLFCNQSSLTNCSQSFCHCTHIYNVEFGSLVEIILVDIGAIYYANHPFHLHGHAFAVLGMERIGVHSTTLKAVQNLEKSKKLMRNFKNPPIKDSVTVPDGGYTVIRFIANNPGYWLFHCHLTFHLETGMAVVFHVGNQKDLPPVPKGFPRCGSWLPKPVNDLHYEISKLTSEVTFGNPFSRIKYNLFTEKKNETTNEQPEAVPHTGGTVRNTMPLTFICFMLQLKVLI
ncbi:Laccase-6, partial [Armadillidium vulgare]